MSRLETPVCTLLGIEVPIVQAGMSTYTTPELVAAVSNAGGLGIIGGLFREPSIAAPKGARNSVKRAYRANRKHPKTIHPMASSIEPRDRSSALVPNRIRRTPLMRHQQSLPAQLT